MECAEKILGRVIGLTGPSGSGKSSVSALIRAWERVLVVDADAVAHYVMTQPDCMGELVDAFSSDILAAEGTLNRRALAMVVFGCPEKLEQLGRISYPYILRECTRQMNEAFANGARAAFLDAPTLFESGANRMCREIVSVVSSKEKRLQRILLRDGITEREAEQRMKNQFDDAFYTERSDFVIRNDGNWDTLKQEVERCRLFLQL